MTTKPSPLVNDGFFEMRLHLQHLLNWAANRMPGYNLSRDQAEGIQDVLKRTEEAALLVHHARMGAEAQKREARREL